MSRSSKTSVAPRFWHLRKVMRARNVASTWELQALLAPHVELSYYRARRLVNGNFSDTLETLDALCFVLRCNISDLVQITYGEDEASMTQPTTVPKARRKKQQRAAVLGRRKPLGDPSDVLPFTVDLSALPHNKRRGETDPSDVVAGKVDFLAQHHAKT
jgi:DNA-binding Xre family transcriptional regulator